jgi:MoaA/NifB/PqqE/SkfB family radical SAM enzyme
MLPTDLNNKMVEEVSTFGLNQTKYIRYTSNGEPLVHPKSYEMLLHAVKHSKSKVTLTTNGTLLKERKMLKLLDTGLHMIDISIDAFKNETYTKIRVGGNLDLTRKNAIKLINLNKKSKGKTKIIISFVQQKENLKETDDFKKYWKEEGADEVLVRELHTNSGSNKNEDLENKKIKRRPCLYPWERIVLTAKGMLSFCPTDWFGKSEIVNYRKSTIHEVWQNNFYKKLRSQHLSNDFQDNNFCKNCPDWSNTSWPHDSKRSYADLVERVLYEKTI